MIECLSDFLGVYEEQLNTEIMDKSYDELLEIYVADCWKSLEVVKWIEFLGYDFNTTESEIDINHHIFRRNRKQPKKNRYKLKMVDDTRCGLFTAHLRISLEETDPKTKQKILREKIIHKDMLIPIADENGMFFINGKNYYIIYQLTEKSTYNTLNSDILKSLMPLIVKRVVVEKEDVNGNTYRLPCYNTFVYRRENPILLYVFANEGVAAGLMDLKAYECVKLVEYYDEESDENLYFQISKECYVEVNKFMFDKYTYIRSIVGGLVSTLTNRFNLSMMNDREQFVKKLTPSNTVEKGMDNLTSFNRMMDETTRKILKLDTYHKEDVYNTLRWMMQEFDQLRAKDNMNLENKRLRCHEYVATLLTQEFSNKLNRIINLGNKADIDTVCDIFKFPGDILLQKMHSSGILRFDESINDMTFFTNFKWTLKGPHSLGGKNENNIMTKYRACHHSYLGKLDLLTCGNSDPGTSGILSPFCKMESLYFDESGEPDDFIFDFMKDVKDILVNKGYEVLDMEFESPEDYYRIVNHCNEFTKNNIAVYGVSKDKTVVQFIKEEDMVAEHLREEGDEDNG